MVHPPLVQLPPTTIAVIRKSGAKLCATTQQTAMPSTRAGGPALSENAGGALTTHPSTMKTPT